jgi:hypothetical protein
MFTKSETNNAIVVKLQNVRKHPNADRIQLATVLGTQIIIGLDMKEGDLVIYFDSNLRLSSEYIKYNNLSSSSDLNLDPKAKGYFPKSGKVRAQKFRGSMSNGFVAPISSVFQIPELGQLSKIVYNDVIEGLEFTHINGVEICSKYFIPVSIPGAPGSRNRKKKTRFIIENFWQHWDTKQMMRNLHQFDETRVVYVEEKIHGTSGRTGNVLVKNNRPWWKFWIPKEEWKIVSGTRRVDNINGHANAIRKAVGDQVANHLYMGEQIYYEIFGYDGQSQIQKGFDYGCRVGEYKVLLYRVTITTPDGKCYDLDREQVYARARELGMLVPTHERHLMDCAGVQEVCKHMTMMNFVKLVGDSLRSSLDSNTLFEGFVFWFQDDEGHWTALKHKSEEFLEFTSKQMDNEVGDPEDNL